MRRGIGDQKIIFTEVGKQLLLLLGGNKDSMCFGSVGKKKQFFLSSQMEKTLPLSSAVVFSPLHA